MHINRSTGHALRIMLACARRDGTLTKVAELARELDLTHQNVFKMIRILSRSGLIIAARGRKGGVKLGRAPADISIGEIVRSIETIALDDGGGTGAKSYSGHLTHAVVDVLDDALLAFISVLERHSLSDVAALNTGAVPTARRSRRQMSKPASQKDARAGITRD